MKLTSTILALFVSLLFPASAYSQVDAPWLQSYQLEGNTEFTSLAIDDAENIYLAGNIDQYSLIIDGQNRVCGVNTAVIIKFDPTGSVLWNHCVNPGQISDIAYSEGSVYLTGKTSDGFIVKRIDAESGLEVTNTNGLNAILSVNDTGTSGANGYGLDIEVRDGFVYFGGMITGAGFNIKRVGSAVGVGALPNNLTPRGVDDFYIGRIDTTFDITQLDVIQMGHVNIPEIEDKFELVSQPTSGIVSVRFETQESTFRFDSTDYSKNVNNDFESLIYTYNFSSEVITGPFTSVQEILYFSDRGTSSGFAWIEQTIFGEYIMNIGFNTTLERGKSLSVGSSVDFTVTGLATSKLAQSYFTIYGYSDANNGTLYGLNAYPADENNGRNNLYALSVSGTNIVAVDLENFGEIDGNRGSDLSVLKTSGGTRYAYSGALDLNTNLLLGATTLPAGSANHFVGTFSSKYFKFLKPSEEIVLKQYEIDTLKFQYEDVSVTLPSLSSHGVKVSNDDFVTSVGVVTSNLNPTSRFERVWDKPDNLSGTYKMTYPNQDTVSFTIEPAGLLTSNPVSVNFGDALLNRTLRDTVVFTNNGTANTTIESVELLNGSDFSIIEALSGDIGIALKDTLIVEYKAHKVGLVKDTVQIKHTGAFGTINYIVQGIGLAISVDAKFAVDSNATQATLPFNPFAVADSTQIGQADTVATYIVSAGTDSLKINSVTFSKGTEFRLKTNPTTPVTLLPTPENGLEDRLLRLDVIFEPTEFKTFKDTLFIQTNDSTFTDGLIAMPLQAVGKDSLGRLEVNFDPIVVNSVLSENDTANVFINLSNTGLDDLIIGSVNFSSDYFELGESVEGNTLLPLVTTEVIQGGNFNAVLQATPNLYDIEGDTTLNETMTIFHNGSGGKSTFDVQVTVVKTTPAIQFDQFFGNNIINNFPSSEVIKELGEVPIQSFSTEQVQFYNIGSDTLTVDGIALFKSIDQNNVDNERLESALSVSKNVLAPGDTSVITLEFELFEFSPFVMSLQIFTDAKEVSFKTSQFSNVSTIETQTGDFNYFYIGDGSVPNKSVQMSELLTDTLHPSFVNILLQATDQQGVGMTFLDQDNPNDLNPDGTGFFSVTENGNNVDPNAAEQDFRIFKQDAIDFEINTALVLDMSTSIPLQDLPKIKEGAKSLVRNLEEDQRIAIYIFSDIVEEKISFTSDTTALINVIDGLQRTGSSTNLFGAVIDAANNLNPLTLSTRDKIARGNIVVFTDGAHNANNLTSSDVNSVTTDLDLYAVGVGAANTSELQAIAGFSGRVFSATDFDALNSEFRKVQREIAKTADSFYVLSYISPSRNTQNVPLVVTIDSPLSGQSLTTNFSSVGFSSLFSQVVVNQNFPELLGIDTLYIPENLDTDVFATTILNAGTPTYKWETSDANIVEITDEDETDGISTLVPQGIEGQFTTVTVTDTSNFNLAGTEFLSKTFTVILGAEVEVPVFTLPILADQTGTFELGSTGISLTISSNTGDAFSLTAKSASNPGTDLPEGIEIVYQDIYWIINLESSGTPDFEYSISLDVSDLTLEIPERVTVLKRDNASSAWVDLSEAGLTVSLVNDIITVSGLSSFSDFAIAQKSETVSTEGFSDIPATFSLEQNYPNPFNPSTVINFGLPNASDVSIALFNVIGQKVMTITNNRYQAGWHNVSVDASGLASGIYIYRIKAGSFVQTKRMTLIK